VNFGEVGFGFVRLLLLCDEGYFVFCCGKCFVEVVVLVFGFVYGVGVEVVIDEIDVYDVYFGCLFV